MKPLPSGVSMSSLTSIASIRSKKKGNIKKIGQKERKVLAKALENLKSTYTVHTQGGKKLTSRNVSKISTKRLKGRVKSKSLFEQIKNVKAVIGDSALKRKKRIKTLEKRIENNKKEIIDPSKYQRKIGLIKGNIGDAKELIKNFSFFDNKTERGRMHNNEQLDDIGDQYDLLMDKASQYLSGEIRSNITSACKVLEIFLIPDKLEDLADFEETERKETIDELVNILEESRANIENEENNLPYFEEQYSENNELWEKNIAKDTKELTELKKQDKMADEAITVLKKFKEI